MKRILLSVAGVLLAVGLARGETSVSCNGKVAAGACDTVYTGAYSNISVTVQCAVASTSEIVLEFQECPDCIWTRFPKSGDAPITNIGSDPNAQARVFRFPPKTYAVRGNILTWGAGAIYVYVHFE